jgi:hypothetical protein
MQSRFNQSRTEPHEEEQDSNLRPPQRRNLSTNPEGTNCSLQGSEFLQSSSVRTMLQHENPRPKIKSWEDEDRAKEQFSSATTGSGLEVVATAIGDPNSDND